MQKNLKNLSNGIDNIKPQENQIEISIFGPGYGESILIHIGNNKWIIIDSCIDSNTKEPHAITYLKKIDVNPTENVIQVIASHWHDDHIRGLNEIISTCKNAEFICSSAVQEKEFLALASLYKDRTMMKMSGIDEFNKILDTIKQRKQNIKLAISDRLLLKTKLKIKRKKVPVEIYSLSPSDKSKILAIREVEKFLNPKIKTKLRIPSINPNHFAVVILVIIGNVNILLGSDIQDSGDVKTGWFAILDSQIIKNKKADIFKIPHHGSKNADNENVWEKLIIENPISVLTPFNRIPLPTKEDVKRIIRNSPESYITANPYKRKKLKRRNSAVKKTIESITDDLWIVNPDYGQVILRRGIDEPNWEVKLVGEAVHLEQIV